MSAAQKLQPQQIKPELKAVFKTSRLVKYTPAPMGKRIIAFLLDILIVGAISKLATAYGVNLIVKDLIMQGLLGFGVSLSMVYFYWVYLPLNHKGTPGKKMMGLRIVTDKHSRQITQKMMLKREFIGRTLSMIVLGLGYLSAFVDKKERRCWHDRFAKTRVIQYR